MEANLLEDLLVRALGRELREQIMVGGGGQGGQPGRLTAQMLGDLSDRLYRLQAVVADANQVIGRVENVLQQLQDMQSQADSDGGRGGLRRTRRLLGGGGQDGGGAS